jgi:hypothetical protein
MIPVSLFSVAKQLYIAKLFFFLNTFHTCHT